MPINRYQTQTPLVYFQVCPSRPDVSELETKLAEQSKILQSLQQKIDDLASKHAYNPDEEYSEVESHLRAHLESFLETARSFNVIYTKEIRPWTHIMEVPQLHGFGPAANRLLKAYKMLWKGKSCNCFPTKAFFLNTKAWRPNMPFP
ncbi:hypothetical protein D5086_024550 [Populus alba]|uniref:Uncharacterized protein n=1 Tax=Populus alba TaxID=43335 RepID=A0ACC4B7E3_POPAL